MTDDEKEIQNSVLYQSIIQVILVSAKAILSSTSYICLLTLLEQAIQEVLRQIRMRIPEVMTEVTNIAAAQAQVIKPLFVLELPELEDGLLDDEIDI